MWVVVFNRGPQRGERQPPVRRHRARAIGRAFVAALVLLLGVSLSFWLWRASLLRSSELTYRPGSVEYLLLTPSLLRELVPLRDEQQQYFVYRYEEKGGWAERWCEAHFPTRQSCETVGRALALYFRRRGYESDPDTGILGKDNHGHLSQVSWYCTTQEEECSVVVTEVEIWDIDEPNVIQRILSWMGLY